MLNFIFIFLMNKNGKITKNISVNFLEENTE